MFFPRGGSAHVARALATELPAHGWDVTILSGSLGGGGGRDAERFYAGLDVRGVDFPAGDAPMHPSFEDRPGAPDPVFAAVDDAAYERHVAAWSAALERVGAASFDVLHLHHLTPLHEAAARVAPGVPVVSHLHGTELLMLEQIEARGHHNCPHAWAWAERMERWATRAERIIVLSDSQVERAERLLDIDPERCVRIPNGFDPDQFEYRRLAHRPHWRRHLVEEPPGWAPDEEPGSIAYADAPLDVFGPDDDPTPVLLYVGRFTEVKRVGLLIEAYARAREGF